MPPDLDAMLDDFDVSWMLACLGSATPSPRCRFLPQLAAAHLTTAMESDLDSDCADYPSSSESRLASNQPGSPGPSPSPTIKSLAYESSIKVFRRHMKAIAMPDGSVLVDSTGVVSRACYEDWLSTRPHATSAPEKRFQRTLTCSVSRTDGRRPFSALEEASVLKQLRMKRVWPAFVGTSFAIGSKGFRSYAFPCRWCRALTPKNRQGYHEKARLSSVATTTEQPTKRAKIAASTPQETMCNAQVGMAPCFNWLAASRVPTADDLSSALRDFEACHPSYAGLAFSVFSVDAAPAQNAVRPHH